MSENIKFKSVYILNIIDLIELYILTVLLDKLLIL